MKACLLICLVVLGAWSVLAAESSPTPAAPTDTYELRYWFSAWEVPKREPDIRATLTAETHFFERQILPIGELRILSGILHAPIKGKFGLDFTLFHWTSPGNNITATTRAELEQDKPYVFCTGSAIVTGHVLLLTRSKSP